MKKELENTNRGKKFTVQVQEKSIAVSYSLALELKHIEIHARIFFCWRRKKNVDRSCCLALKFSLSSVRYGNEAAGTDANNYRGCLVILTSMSLPAAHITLSDQRGSDWPDVGFKCAGQVEDEMDCLPQIDYPRFIRIQFIEPKEIAPLLTKVSYRIELKTRPILWV